MTAQRELSRKCNANIKRGHLANAMTHLQSTSDTYYALHDRTEDAINTYKFIKNQVHTNLGQQSDEPVEYACTPDKSTSTTNANKSNLSSPSCSIPPSLQSPSKSFATMHSRRKMTADEESKFKEAVANLSRDENLPIKSIISSLNNCNFFTSCPSAK